MSEYGEIYIAGKNFTLPLAVTAWTNSTPARVFNQDESRAHGDILSKLSIVDIFSRVLFWLLFPARRIIDFEMKFFDKYYG